MRFLNGDHLSTFGDDFMPMNMNMNMNTFNSSRDMISFLVDGELFPRNVSSFSQSPNPPGCGILGENGFTF